MAVSGNGDLLALLVEMKKYMEAGKEEMKNSMDGGQEEMKKSMKAVLEQLLEEMKARRSLLYHPPASESALVMFPEVLRFVAAKSRQLRLTMNIPVPLWQILKLRIFHRKFPTVTPESPLTAKICCMQTDSSQYFRIKGRHDAVEFRPRFPRWLEVSTMPDTPNPTRFAKTKGLRLSSRRKCPESYSGNFSMGITSNF
ncbi:hypothetical protein HNY73_006448 [Argiope bruennichi]|uniref:Uncharacterized protein n=1 Tax=Argiope bruennichi TaxID=94029 RepID=A0A8T0FK37_ARGBR|nr:hypothetical protein HNY73_006448 [Argiope bruennichi]